MPHWPALSTRVSSQSMLLTVLMLAYAAIASGLAARSAQVTIALLIPVVAVILLTLRRRDDPPQPMSPLVRRAVWLWASLLVAGLLWEAWAFFHQPAWNVASYDHPTISALIEPYFDHRVVRFGAWTLWLYAGFRLVRR